MALQQFLEKSASIGSVRLGEFVEQREAKLVMEDIAEQELSLLQEKIPEYVKDGIANDAKGALKHFLQQYPKCLDALLILADIYRHQNNWQSAIKTYYAALYCYPENSRVKRLLQAMEESCLAKISTLPHIYKVWMFSPKHRPYAPDSEFLSPFAAFYDGSEKFQILEDGTNRSCRVIARVSLYPGETVAKVTPFVTTPHILPDGEIFFTCFHCLKERKVSDTPAYSCPSNPHTCPFVFCSWDCLMKNVRIHALECPKMAIILAAARESNLPYSSVLHILRALFKASLEQEHVSEERETLGQLFCLPSFYGHVKQGQQQLFHSFSLLAERIQLEFPPLLYLNLPRGDLIEIMIIIWTHSCYVKFNSATAFQQQLDPQITSGLVLCPLLGRFHHSCVPTCCYSFDEGGTVTIRTICNVPPGGTLCVSVLPDLYIPQNERKSFRNQPKIFGCGCSRCITTDEEKCHIRSIRCKVCIRGFCCPQKQDSLQKALNFYSVLGPRNSAITSSNENSKNKEDVAVEHGASQQIWKCRSCGEKSIEFSQYYCNVEKEIIELMEDGEAAFIIGKTLQARKIFRKLTDEYSAQLHPNHYILYNANTMLAGLLRHNPGKNIGESLVCLRRAIIAAEAVLPPCHTDKLHLYVALADVTFCLSNLYKLSNRGTGLPDHFLLEPIHTALWNADVTLGANSTIRLLVLQKLRKLASVTNICTPPLHERVGVVMWDSFLRFCRDSTENSTLEMQVKISKCSGCTDAADIASRDPAFPAFQAVKKGIPISASALAILKYFKDVKHLGNGLNVLGIAAMHSHSNLVEILLKEEFPFMDENEWKITPLLAMSASILPGINDEDEYVDRKQSAILRMFVRKSNELDQRLSRKTGTTKALLLSACTNSVLGTQSALHYSVIRRKVHLTRQLIKSGHPVMLLNDEYATPLHLAIVGNCYEVTEEMLKHKIDVHAKTKRGETAFLLSAYNLNVSTGRLLVTYDAKVVDAVTEFERVNVFHAVVLGICKINTISFKTISDTNSAVAVALSGMNDATCGFDYTLIPTSLDSKDHKELQHRIIEPENRNLFIFPSHMLKRLTKGIKWCEFFHDICPETQLLRRTTSGYTPIELFDILWKNFCIKRAEISAASELYIAGFTREQKQGIENGWTAVSQLVNRIMYILRDVMQGEKKILQQ
ncbi:putative histone lysine methyltransferase, SET [Cardiosporidium cionae]|uniref:Histone lysine methyltransferase, SET n=1 Tax=Cardiosporidium cionae TaxID=476202 RepID=A0ABQ7JFE8_9APIC|nr:putative histone lysine methyltransferase, SET [Cardiosporidium cionae]|eukprot:KAF8822370.1 putative histone lysine methyltransferase, SET [Cardiosporidium cionae]